MVDKSLVPGNQPIPFSAVYSRSSTFALQAPALTEVLMKALSW